MPYLKISLISFPPLCVFKHTHTHTHLTTRLPQITISCFSSHIQPLLTYNYTLYFLLVYFLMGAEIMFQFSVS